MTPQAAEMPTPENDDQRSLLQSIWDAFVRLSSWPSVGEVDRTLDRLFGVDLLEVGADLPRELVYPPDVQSWSTQQELRLTVAGAAACEGSAEVLGIFLDSVRLAAEIERGWGGADRDPELTASDVSSRVTLPASGRDATLAQVGLLLRVENWGWSSGGSTADRASNWQFFITRNVRRFRNVQGLREYWALSRPEEDQSTANEAIVTNAASRPDRRKVFVIHGRNERARKGLFEFLRSIGLEPIEWSQAIAMTGKGSPYIGEVLDAAFGAAQAVIILQTPDDVAYLHPSLTDPDDPECEPQLQPRPNVLFEAGMAMGRDQDRTVIVELGRVKVFSDIHGRHVVRLDDTVGKRQDLAQRLRTANCEVDLTGQDWHTAGNLAEPPAPGLGLPLGRKLPTAQSSAVPRLDGRYIDNGAQRMDQVEITNYGPGDVYELEVTAEKKEGLVTVGTGDWPVPKLPAGKSVRVMRTTSLGSNSYFSIAVTGKTVDGVPLEQEIFVSRV